MHNSHTNTHTGIQCLSLSYCIDLKVIIFGVYQASVGFDCVYYRTHTCIQTQRMGQWVDCVYDWIWTERPQINTRSCTHTHMLGKRARTVSLSLSWLLWTERPQLFSFQTKETLWFNIKHMVGYLMALYSDYKGGRVGEGKRQREGRGQEQTEKF